MGLNKTKQLRKDEDDQKSWAKASSRNNQQTVWQQGKLCNNIQSPKDNLNKQTKQKNNAEEDMAIPKDVETSAASKEEASTLTNLLHFKELRHEVAGKKVNVKSSKRDASSFQKAPLKCLSSNSKVGGFVQKQSENRQKMARETTKDKGRIELKNNLPETIVAAAETADRNKTEQTANTKVNLFNCYVSIKRLNSEDYLAGTAKLSRGSFMKNKWNKPIIAERKKNPYSIEISEDLQNTRTEPLSNIQNGQVFGLADKVLSNLFAVKNDLANQKFEMKINDVRFVGHPSSLQTNKDNFRQWSSKEPQTVKTTINLFNVVFALRANATHSIVNCYHRFSERLAAALRHEEMRCNYLSNEAKLMTKAHDEVNAVIEDYLCPYDTVLKKSQLAMDLETVYKDLVGKGMVDLRINKWIAVSFCLPHKIHRLRNNLTTIYPEEIHNCLEALRPYHGILLLEEKKSLMESLPLDASPSLVRLIWVSSPLKCLQVLATDCDLTLTHVFQLVGHLLFWSKATVIYPLCENNVYILSPKAPTHITSPLMASFTEKFPGVSLLAVMSEFSLPISLSQWSSPINIPEYQNQHVHIIVWMLQHHLLIQLHTYIYLVTSKASQSALEPEASKVNQLQNNADFNFKSDIEVESVTSDDLSESFSRSLKLSESAGSSVNLAPEGEGLSGADLVFKHLVNTLLEGMSLEDKKIILNIPAASNQDDLINFLKLLPYFKGEHHIEEIMYFKNTRRSQLNALLDKFRDVLITCQHEDVAVATFYRAS